MAYFMRNIQNAKFLLVDKNERKNIYLFMSHSNKNASSLSLSFSLSLSCFFAFRNEIIKVEVV